MRLEPFANGALMLLGLGKMLPEDLDEVRIAGSVGPPRSCCNACCSIEWASARYLTSCSSSVSASFPLLHDGSHLTASSSTAELNPFRAPPAPRTDPSDLTRIPPTSSA